MGIEPENKGANAKKWTRQQDEEWQAFESFSADFPLPKGFIERTDKPDVVIHGDRKLGIELTTLHIEPGGSATSEQSQVKPRLTAVALAQEAHIEAEGRPIEWVIGFNPKRPITDVKALARAISEVAARVQHGKRGQIDRLTYDHLPSIDFMYLAGEYAEPRWRVQQSYRVRALDVDRVRKVVAEKIEKAKEYQTCDAMWLLITVDFWNPAQDQDLKWPVEERIDCGPYEHVFLYKAAYRQVIEVPRT